jgi:putative hydrolase of HD superfamily
MQQVIDFVLEIDKLKGVTRKTRPLGLERYENSAEHSWQIALLAVTLAQQAKADVDIDRVVGMLLVHDIGEIDTGDTIVYMTEGQAERKRAERVAVERIFGLLPDASRRQLMSLWEEFEAGETPESKFANAADRAMPVLLNLANNGQSWRENGITYQRVVNRISAQIKDGCPELWDYIDAKLRQADAEGWFGSRTV